MKVMKGSVYGANRFYNDKRADCRIYLQQNPLSRLPYFSKGFSTVADKANEGDNYVVCYPRIPPPDLTSKKYVVAVRHPT